MEAAEEGRSAYRRVADRAAQLYAPLVHLTALCSFAGWVLATGDAHRSITIAIAVLIITCPCALGLAVPMVQVVAARRLFASGIMMKDGSGLERLAEIDSVIFDKTGTLTRGEPRLVRESGAGDADLRLAATIATHSRHPYARALAAAKADRATPVLLERVSEYPGLGLEAYAGGSVYRLGRREWALGEARQPQRDEADDAGTVLSGDGRLIAEFHFDDHIRPGGQEAVGELLRMDLTVGVVSGDRPVPVRRLAATLGITRVEAEVLPGEKAGRIAALTKAGHRVLMVGDGLNDAPALAAAHVSMAPASAADIGRSAADFVFLRESLAAVPFAVAVARNARRLIRQNFSLAIAYNLLAIPIAVSGQVTPLIAALAMSLSSVIVVANALRLQAPAEGSVGEVPGGTATRHEPAVLAAE
jgi:Cu2+-exporting ATPase